MKSVVINLLIGIFIAVPFNVFSGQFVAYMPELFSEAMVGMTTEYACYLAFKDRVIEGDFSIVAAPWTRLIKNQQYTKIEDSLFVKNGVTVCNHFKFEEIIPTLQKIGVEVLFCPHVDSTKDYPITVLPIAHFPYHTAEPAAKKDLLYSFIGFRSHKARGDIFDLLRSTEDVCIKERKGWHFHGRPRIVEKRKQEYLSVNAKSRFGLCPRGFGPGTIRFWELLGSGTIPVLLSDVLVLPQNFDWDSTILRIPESAVDQLDTIIRNIPESVELQMRENCIKAYHQFCGDNIIFPIVAYMQEQAASKEVLVANSPQRKKNKRRYW